STHSDCEYPTKNASEERQRHPFQEKLSHDISAAGADRFADTDLVSPLGHADEHDVHHADAAHQQAHTGNSDHEQTDGRGDVVKLLDEFVGRIQIEIVRLIEFD